MIGDGRGSNSAVEYEEVDHRSSRTSMDGEGRR